jgi:hypothetical protein
MFLVEVKLVSRCNTAQHEARRLMARKNYPWVRAHFFSPNRTLCLIQFKRKKKDKNKIRKKKREKKKKSSMRTKPGLGSGKRLEVSMTLCACWASRAGRAHNAQVAFLSSI